jgi:hypothetical protein
MAMVEAILTGAIQAAAAAGTILMAHLMEEEVTILMAHLTEEEVTILADHKGVATLMLVEEVIPMPMEAIHTHVLPNKPTTTTKLSV